MQIDLVEKSFKNINHDARPEVGMVISLKLRWAKRLPPPVIKSHWCSKEIRGRKRKLRQRNRERDQAQEEEALPKKPGKRYSDIAAYRLLITYYTLPGMHPQDLPSTSHYPQSSRV